VPERGQFLDQWARFRPGEREAKQILDLAGEDDDGDAGSKSHGDRVWDELDVGAETQEASGNQ
jgi:hypothetical protein